MNKQFMLSVVTLFCANTSFAGLTSLDDSDLSEINGAEGIGIQLNDVQVATDEGTTLSLQVDSDTLALYGNRFQLYRQGATNPSVIRDESGVTIGSISDPITFNIQSVPQLNAQGNYVDLNYLTLALPSKFNTLRNSTLDQTGFTGSTYARKANSELTWTTIPFPCSGAAKDCLTAALRLRADIFKYASLTPAGKPKQIDDRLIVWAKVDGVRLNGTYIDVWSDETEGLSLSVNISAYIDSVHLTTKTNEGANTLTSSSTVTLTQFAQDRGETIDTIKKTAPYSDDDTPIFKSGNYNTGLKLSNIFIDAHIGNKSYQPLSLQTVLTPINRAAPTPNCAGGHDIGGKRYCPDDVTSDLRLKLSDIPNDPKVYNDFYSDPKTKTNIYIDNVTMGDGINGATAANGGGYHIISTASNPVGYNFGSTTVQGLRIQRLSFKTQDLKPLTTQHCPTGWTCSFQ